MDINPNKRKARGLKWTDAEIKEMLKVASELKVNELFESHRMNALDIYGQIAEKWAVKDKHQIKLKFEVLRRSFTAEKLAKIKSGAAGGSQTIYDDEMVELWGQRKKFTVPNAHGLDTTLMHLNPSENVMTDNDEHFSEHPESPNSSYDNVEESGARVKRRKKTATDAILLEFKKETQTLMSQFDQMNKTAEESADRRCESILEEMRSIRQSLAAAGPSTIRTINQIPFHSTPTPFKNHIIYTTPAPLVEDVYYETPEENGVNTASGDVPNEYAKLCQSLEEEEDTIYF